MLEKRRDVSSLGKGCSRFASREYFQSVVLYNRVCVWGCVFLCARELQCWEQPGVFTISIQTAAHSLSTRPGHVWPLSSAPLGGNHSNSTQPSLAVHLHVKFSLLWCVSQFSISQIPSHPCWAGACAFPNTTKTKVRREWRPSRPTERKATSGVAKNMFLRVTTSGDK